MPGSNRKSSSFDIVDEEESPGWLMTYADLVTLLLVFFVMLFSISTLDLVKFKAIAQQLSASFGEPTALIALEEPDVGVDEKGKEAIEKKEEEIRDIPVEVLEGLDDDLLRDVKKFVDKKKIGDNIVVYQEKNRITIMVEGQALFDSGQADLRGASLPILDDIMDLIQKHPKYRINIKGHTDDQPIHTLQFPSNWELSAVRATTVLRYLIAKGVNPKRLTATGYGELLPIAPNDTPENRTKNRRVEFVLEKEKSR